LAVTFSIYVGYFIPLTPVASKIISIALIGVLSVVNYAGVREGAWVQRTFTYLKIGALVVLVAAAFTAPRHAPVYAAASQSPISSASIGFAMAACLMAYNGWSFVSFVAGEVKHPERNLLRSLALGVAAVMVLYVSTNVAYLRVMTIPEIAASERVGADLATRTIGPIGGTFVSLAVLLSITGAVNGGLLTGARIPFAQARDGLFFARFGEIHPRFQTPATAIVLGGVWSSILILSGSYETLYSYSILAAWIFYTMSVAAVFTLRRKFPEAVRPYRMWGYPWTLLLFVVVSVWFMVNSCWTQPGPSFAAFGLVAAGALVYKLWQARMHSARAD
jgi:APA family basic amino acid/polyamine antiporter